MNDKSNTREFSRDFTYTYCEQENINSSINVLIETVLDTYNKFVDEMKGILCNFYTVIRDNIFLELQILGDLEWCYLEIEELEDSKLLDISPIYLKEHLDNNGQESIKEIDEYISSFFTKKIIESIAARIVLNLDTNDVKKLSQAMVDLRARRYLDCANLLASLIDSQSIKQELYDMNNSRYKEESINVSQGWNAFFIVFQNDLVKYFDGKSFCKGNKLKREKGFKNFIEEVKSNFSNYEMQLPILLLASCLIKFFDDSNWKNYPHKPEVINRHWLMHGMYDIEDITKSDCIKLLLILNQLADIYAKLRRGEL